jgi:hypothetical protein
MATDAQIAANRENAKKSTGPRSAEGKLASRKNALKHGNSSDGPVAIDRLSAEFQERNRLWKAEQDPRGPHAEWAMEQAVAASLTIDQCNRAVDQQVALESRRAHHAWDADRRLLAADVAARLAKAPLRTIARLETTYHGVELLIDMWVALAEALETQGGWGDSDRELALDLLGVEPRFRASTTRLIPPEGTSELDHFNDIVTTQVKRLETERDGGLLESEIDEYTSTVRGDVVLKSAAARLFCRYREAAWRRLTQALEVVRSSHPVRTSPRDPAARNLEIDARAARVAETKRLLAEQEAINKAIKFAELAAKSAPSSNSPRPTVSPQLRPVTHPSNFIDIAIVPRK